MFGPLTETVYDLCFRIGRIPVRVHPLFWLITAMLGWRDDQPQLTVLWVICVFLSILIHELGHAVVTEFFGWRSRIYLYGGGGLTVSDRYFGDTPWKSLLICLAGPFAGFAVYGAIRFSLDFIPVPEGLLGDAFIHMIRFLLVINFFWGIINLLPVYPLDGGQALLAICQGIGLRSAPAIVGSVSAVTGTLVALYFFSNQNYFMTFMFGMMVYENLMSLQNRR